MNKIGQLMELLAPQEALNETNLSGVRLYKTSQHMPPFPLLYDKGIIIVGQGWKCIHLGDVKYEYNPDNYLVVSVPLPAECETFGSKEEPFVCMMIDIDTALLNTIIAEINDNSRIYSEETAKGLFVAEADPLLKNTVERLLTVLQSPIESRVIGPGLIKEIIFRILSSEHASCLYDLAAKHTNLSRINRALQEIHQNFQFNIEVQDLAELVNMSISAFHRTFKEVTSMSPIQYIKKFRLNKARSFITEEKVRVNEAARMVGYESVSHFSREFKKYFGRSPKEATFSSSQ